MLVHGGIRKKKLEPLVGIHDEGGRGLQFTSDLALLDCVTAPAHCSASPVLRVRLLHVKYVPTFWSTAPLGRLRVFRRGASIAESFEIHGTGSFVLRLFPAGSRDAPPGRCSAFVSGPPGVELAYVLRVGDTVVGSVDEPLQCADAGVGCSVRNAGWEYNKGKWKSVAISIVSAAPPHWKGDVEEGDVESPSHHSVGQFISKILGERGVMNTRF